MRVYATALSISLFAHAAAAACNAEQEFGCLPVTRPAWGGGDARFRDAPDGAVRPAQSWSAGLELFGSVDSVRSATRSPSLQEQANPVVAERLEAALRASYSLHPALAVRLALPLVLAQSGWLGAQTGAFNAPASPAVGDLHVSGEHHRAVAQGLRVHTQLTFSLPTAGSDALAGARGVSMIPAMSIVARRGAWAGYLTLYSRTTFARRDRHEAPTSWVGSSAGVLAELKGQALALNLEARAEASLQAVTPFAQERDGRPANSLEGQHWLPLSTSVGVASQGTLCDGCTLHASLGTTLPTGFPNVGAPAASALLRFHKQFQ